MQVLGRFCIPANHPCLAGHFPGRPIVPGVVLLDAVFAIVAGSAGVSGLPVVKFLDPVLPEQEVEVLADPPARGRVAFACRVGGRDVLRGSLQPTDR
jgi:3-hydroxyacyl-[acyl-carrier-protein] dehydratase